MLNLLVRVSTSKLGTNHLEIGIRSDLDLVPGTYNDVIARPAGAFVTLVAGRDEQPGCLFVGEAGWNARFLTELPSGSPLPGAIEQPGWAAADAAGAAEVYYYAVRVLPGQKAYVQSSGYKGRRGWKIAILSADGSVRVVTEDELRDELEPAGCL